MTNVRRSAPVVVAFALLFGLMPTSVLGASAVDCGPDDGRERLTSSGFALSFSAPVVTAPELAATRLATGNAIAPYRSAQFPFTVDLAPAASGVLTAQLGWETPQDLNVYDFDLYVYDSNGDLVAYSDAINALDGTYSEEAVGDLRHCERITVVVTNWMGGPGNAPPDEKLYLRLSLEPGAELLACLEGDTAPGCAGKPAGAAPDPVADTRSRLYLGGDPGAVAMLHGYPAFQGDVPFRGRLEPTRPTGGVPNGHARVLVGFRDQYQNPLVPHFTTGFDEPTAIRGDVTALLWLSSPTMDATGTLFADLYTDGGLVSSVPVNGALLKDDPAPVAVTFPGLDIPELYDLTLQVATEPTVSTRDGVGNRSHAVVTLHYGSVQFPSRLTLP